MIGFFDRLGLLRDFMIGCFDRLGLFRDSMIGCFDLRFKRIGKGIETRILAVL